MLFVTHIILSIVITSQSPMSEVETCIVNSHRTVEIGILNPSEITYLLKESIIISYNKFSEVDRVDFFNYSDKLLNGNLRRKDKKWVIQ